jgi:hypothetical protein
LRARRPVGIGIAVPQCAQLVMPIIGCPLW